MSLNIQENWSSLNTCPIHAVIDIAGPLKSAINAIRFVSENEVTEYAFYIYRDRENGTLRCGEPIRGGKARVALDSEAALRARQPSEDMAGTCHSHPYFWKLSKKAAIGPSSPDTRLWTEYARSSPNSQIHFVIANWRLFALIYPAKFSNTDCVEEDTPLVGVLPHWLDRENRYNREKMHQEESLQRYNKTSPFQRLFKSKPVVSSPPFKDAYEDWMHNYCYALNRCNNNATPQAYSQERALYKKYKHSGQVVQFNRAEEMTINSYKYLKEYCIRTGIHLFVGEIPIISTKLHIKRGIMGKPEIANISPDFIKRVI